MSSFFDRESRSAGTGFGISVCVHAVCLLILSMLFTPVDVGRFGTLRLDVARQVETHLDTFTISSPDVGLDPVSWAPVGDGLQLEADSLAIHTIAYEEDGGRTEMEALAVRTAGEFRFVAAIETDGRVVNAEKHIAVISESFLSMAKLLESRGQLGPALDRYRRIVSEFPKSAAAVEARKRARFLAARRRR